MSGSDKASPKISKVGKALGTMGKIMGGIIGANLFMKLGQGIKNLGGDAFNAVADFERMGFSLKALIATELARGEIVQKGVSKNIQLSASERLELANLEKAYGSMNDKIRLAQTRYDQLAKSKGKDNIKTLQAAANLEKLNANLGSQGNRLNFLQDAADGTISSLEMMREGVLDMADVMADPKTTQATKKLVKDVQMLALSSPFDQRSVTLALQTAMAYGLTKDAAFELTKNTIDWAAATGKSEEVLTSVSRALGQVSSKTRLMGQEVNQMAEAGIAVLPLLAEEYSVTTRELQKMISQGMVPAADVLRVVNEYLSESFGGTAQRQTLETWHGLRNAMGDIKEIGLQ